MDKNILITGSCGVTSRSVLRSLKKSPIFKNSIYIGTDICENIYGVYEGLYNKIYKVADCNSYSYKETMINIIKKENIDVAIIIPEPEVLCWSKENFPCQYIIPPFKFCENVINKGKLYNLLTDTGLIPMFIILNREDINNISLRQFETFPLWMRDFSTGGTSGYGAIKIESIEDAVAWAHLNRNIDKFLISDYLPGKNYACHLLFYYGKLKKIASYERLKYFMPKVAPSGITGNIAMGRLINHKEINDIAIKAVTTICNYTNELMHGLVAVDLKSDSSGKPMVTEINIRHVAATSAFADADFNLAQDQVLLALDRTDLLTHEIEKYYHKSNIILRDIDGPPIWIEKYKEMSIGDSFSIYNNM